MQPLKNCIGPTIRIGRESWCLLYAGFFSSKPLFGRPGRGTISFPTVKNPHKPLFFYRRVGVILVLLPLNSGTVFNGPFFPIQKHCFLFTFVKIYYETRFLFDISLSYGWKLFICWLYITLVPNPNKFDNAVIPRNEF